MIDIAAVTFGMGLLFILVGVLQLEGSVRTRVDVDAFAPRVWQEVEPSQQQSHLGIAPAIRDCKAGTRLTVTNGDRRPALPPVAMNTMYILADAEGSVGQERSVERCEAMA